MDKKTFGLLGLGCGTMVWNCLKYCKIDDTGQFHYMGPITGTNSYWYKKKENTWVLLRGSHFLSIYNQVYYKQLTMSIGPMFYHSKIQASIL